MRRSGLMASIGEAQVYLALVAAVEARGEDAARPRKPRRASPADDGAWPDSDAETTNPPM